MSIVPIYRYFSRGVTPQRFQEICSAAGITSIHASIISGRCGSTLLSHVTKKVAFGLGEEPFNEWPESKLREWAEPDSFDEFLFKIMKVSAIEGRFYFQIDPLRLEAMSHLLPRGEEPFPNVSKFTAILRRNIVAQALSYRNAHATGLWHSNQSKVDPLSNNSFVEEDVLFWIEHIHRMEQKMATTFHGSSPDTYFYEDFAAAPSETISLFLHCSGFTVGPAVIAEAINDDAAPKKIVREGYLAQYLSVMNRYPWLSGVLTERNSGTIPSPTLERMITTLAES